MDQTENNTFLTLKHQSLGWTLRPEPRFGSCRDILAKPKSAKHHSHPSTKSVDFNLGHRLLIFDAEAQARPYYNLQLSDRLLGSCPTGTLEQGGNHVNTRMVKYDKSIGARVWKRARGHSRSLGTERGALERNIEAIGAAVGVFQT